MMEEQLLSNWLLPVISRFEAIANLPPGWGGDDSETPAQGFLLGCLKEVLSFMPYRAHPPSVLYLHSGGVQLEWHCGGWDIEVEFRPEYVAEYWGENHETKQAIDGTIGDHKELTKAISALNKTCEQCAGTSIG